MVLGVVCIAIMKVRIKIEFRKVYRYLDEKNSYKCYIQRIHEQILIRNITSNETG